MPPRSSPRVNIVYRDNGRGLTRDAHILHAALQARSCRVTRTAQSPIDPPGERRFAVERLAHAHRQMRDRRRRWLASRLGRPLWDLNLFVETIDPEYLPLARVNWFVPNQEWMSDREYRYMRDVDRTLFKTRHAEARLGPQARGSVFVGFTSEDRRDDRIDRCWGRALHVAGWNPTKGTARLLRAWHEHPEWPRLSVIAEGGHRADASNIDLRSRPISDSALRRLQNRCPIHVALSEVEGFGHTLNEALSCGSILITTNAPPMNEVANEGAALLVDFESTEPMASGLRYKFAESSLADVVRHVLAMTHGERMQCAVGARRAYDAGRSAFLSRFGELLESI